MNLTYKDPDLILLLSVITFGTFLRLYNLDFNSIWIDEAYTLSISSQSLIDIWSVSTTTDFMPPLFYWIEHLILMGGNSEVLLRLVPALSGIVLIVVSYYIGKEYSGVSTGLILSSLFAFSPVLIRYSQEARSYMPSLVFVALAFLFYLKSSKSNSFQDLVLLGILSGIAFWFHYFTILFTGILILLGIVSGIRNVVIPGSVFIITTFPLLIVIPGLILHRSDSISTFGIHGIELIYTAIGSIAWYENILVGVVVLVVIPYLILTYRESRTLLALIIIPILVSVVVSDYIPLMPRYLLFLTIPIYLGIAKMLSYSLVPPLFIALVILCISIPSYGLYYTEYSKEDWRGTGKVLEGLTSDGDVVVVVPGYNRGPLDYYYSFNDDNTTEVGITRIEELAAIPTGKIWVVGSKDILVADATGNLKRWIDSNTTRVYDGRVWINSNL